MLVITLVALIGAIRSEADRQFPDRKPSVQDQMSEAVDRLDNLATRLERVLNLQRSRSNLSN